MIEITKNGCLSNPNVEREHRKAESHHRISTPFYASKVTFRMFTTTFSATNSYIPLYLF